MPYPCEGCLGVSPATYDDGSGVMTYADGSVAVTDYTPYVVPGSTVYAPAPGPIMVLPSDLPGGTPQYLPDLVANVPPATAGVPWWTIVILLGVAAVGLHGSKRGSRGWF